MVGGSLVTGTGVHGADGGGERKQGEEWERVTSPSHHPSTSPSRGQLGALPPAAALVGPCLRHAFLPGFSCRK
eukprot:15471415-Alexandrium_andersonii.AAC.1